ncbi:glycosyltransferase family 39 protein [Nocardia cyriacigeorgica]|uniref:glycosyltransferase family 39 protein n=1 Tax=Nocardia cyriacigeorgica TaxID=135487 RepID=UPI0024539C7A|nr:glycosyltransferase family 39 protein [Nocardia cyriacigeorgica]
MNGASTTAVSAATRSAAPAVAAIAGVTGLISTLRAGRYDYFGDELYFLAAGRHPAPSYVDQGPLVPLLARGIDLVPTESLLALRFPSILCAVAAVVCSAAIARELGGDRAAQIWAAAAYASCPFLITQSATLSTFAFDSVLSAVLIWALIRWTRTRRDRWLLVAAAVLAVDIQVKPLVGVLAAGLLAGVIATGPHELLRRPALWFGALVVVVTALPGLWWQYRHGWPQLAMGAVIRAEQGAATGGASGLPLQIGLSVGLLGAILAAFGLWILVSDAVFRPYRFVLAGGAALLMFVVVAGGRPYYLAGMFPVLFAAGAVAITWQPALTVRRVCAAALTVSVVIAILAVTTLPRPESARHGATDTGAEMATRLRLYGTEGWDELTSTVAAAVRELPAADRGSLAIVTHNYWQAAALEILGPPDLPPVYSPNRGYAEFGMPASDVTTIVSVTTGATEPALHRAMSTCTPIAHRDDDTGFPGIDRHLRVWRCDHPRQPWPEIWSGSTTPTFDPGL